ncbi:hypothetical protein BDW59DRAFT_170557 [Aspergillus cavernicola]|uniref:Aminoglycoside phosphotransferase domain-containing protein n=1 Tax=Aspergillus cavernicola TaxID=176166 RepID=A0ABR4IP57_9EURO
MLRTRQLLHEEITYSVARKREVNILHRLNYPSQKAQFFSLLESKRSWIQSIVAHHLNLQSTNAYRVADVQEWIHGSFNVCIPDFRPGNADEKVRCEAGTYAWLEETCPDIPIPRLYGFAMSTGETQLTPFPSKYIRHQSKNKVPECGRLNVGYLLIEYIEETKGKMLSSTWALKQDNMKLRTNFFRDLSKIYLSLSRTPLPRIGSFIINNNGFLLLDNRPLSLEIQDLENERIPTDIPRDQTYSTVESFVVDTLSYHDNRLRCQPNAINDLGDYIYQTARLTTMRAIFPSFFNRDLRRGPFIYSLTDLHQSNIFVDDNWHITSLVDLEWACSLPIEMVQPPHWLTSMAVDRIVSHEYNKVRLAFMSALTTEEESYRSRSSNRDSSAPLRLSRLMGTAWDRGTFWYSLALSSPTGLFAIFDKELQPRFINKCPDHVTFDQIMPWYWEQDIVSTLTRKRGDREAYDIQLRHKFEVDICST